MLYKNNQKYKNNINIFGLGEVYEQIKPLLVNHNILIEKMFDDTRKKSQYNINEHKHMDNKDILFCIGYSDMIKRYTRYKEIKEMGFNPVSFISDNSIFSLESTIGNGSIINQGCIIDNFVEIGECVFVNIGSMISHHSIIRDNVFIAPGVNIAGCSIVNEGVFLGTNATIIDHINIGRYSVIAAGAVVIEDVPPYCMVAGNPATIKKRLFSNGEKNE